MALTGALCQTLLAATGFTNNNLRVLIAGLLGNNYRPNQMTYDLRRLRLADSSAAYPTPTATSSHPRASASPSSTPKSTTGSWFPSPPLINPSHHPSYAWPYAPLTITSTATPTALASNRPPET